MASSRIPYTVSERLKV